VKRKLKTGEGGQSITTTPLQCLVIHCATCFGFGYKPSWGTIKILVRRAIFYNMTTFSATY